MVLEVYRVDVRPFVEQELYHPHLFFDAGSHQGSCTPPTASLVHMHPLI
jgi:hypothetical protein